MTCILQTHIPESSPEEWNVVVDDLFSEHIQSSNITLEDGLVIMLDSHVLAGVEEWIGCDISCCENVRQGTLEINVSLNSSVLVLLDSIDELSVRSHSSTQDNNIRIQSFTIRQFH